MICRADEEGDTFYIVLSDELVPPMKKGVEGLPSRTYRRLSLFNPLAYLGLKKCFLPAPRNYDR